METEFAVAGPENVHPADWTAEDEHKVELMQRYKTSAERSFYRALNMARQLLKERIGLEKKMRDLKAQMNRMEKRDREVEARDEVKRGPQGNAEAEAEAKLAEGAEAELQTPEAEPAGVRGHETQRTQRVFRVREAKPVVVERGEWKCEACGGDEAVLDAPINS
jgi:ribosomal protein S14